MIERYTRPEMEKIFSDSNRYQKWLRVELEALKACQKFGLVPPFDIASLEKSVSIDIDRIAAIEAETHHDVIAFLTMVGEQSPELGKWLHFGMTSNDLIDTSAALVLAEASGVILDDIMKCEQELRKLALEHNETLCIGRSHGIHAEATTFGLKVASWLTELRRNLGRFEEAAAGCRFGKLSGPVGTHSHLSEDVEAMVMSSLDLQAEPVATQVVPRDRHAHLLNTMSLLAAGAERIAIEIRHLQRTEVSEVFEPFSKTQKGSSAMPHKRNPILSENISGLSRLVRSYAGATIENIALWHERDISHSSVERVVIPDAFLALDFLLTRLTKVLAGLEVNKRQMEANLHLTGGQIFSSSILLALVNKGLTRDDAYRVIQSCALDSTSSTFLEAISRNEEICSVLSESERAECCTFDNLLRYSREKVNRIAGN